MPSCHSSITFHIGALFAPVVGRFSGGFEPVNVTEFPVASPKSLTDIGTV